MASRGRLCGGVDMGRLGNHGEKWTVNYLTRPVPRPATFSRMRRRFGDRHRRQRPGDGRQGEVVFCPLVPWQFDPKKQMNLKRSSRCSSCLVTRLLEGLSFDAPEEWDDPYRFFRW